MIYVCSLNPVIKTGIMSYLLTSTCTIDGFRKILPLKNVLKRCIQDNGRFTARHKLYFCKISSPLDLLSKLYILDLD